MESQILIVFVAAMITALATGLGALPLLVMRNVTQRRMGYANAVAVGLMLAASHALIGEGVVMNPSLVLVGVVVGVALIMGADRIIDHGAEPDISDLAQADAGKALLILGIMTAHSFAEGIGVGVSFAGPDSLSSFITAAIALHNVPEGLAIALVLVPMGMPVWKAALWAIFTSLPQPLMAVPAFLFVEWFAPVLPGGLGLAAGAMMWMVFSELLPEAQERSGPSAAAAIAVFSFAAMMWVQIVLL